MSFTKFPQFQDLSTSDYPTYLHYFSLLEEPCSDLSLDNALIWLDFNGSFEVSDLHGNMVIRFTNIFDGNRLYYSLIGSNRLNETLDELFDYLCTKTRHPKLAFVPEQVANQIIKLRNPHLHLDEDIDNRDYIYHAPDLVKMEGKTYKNLRGRVNTFLHANPEVNITPFDLDNPAARSLIKATVRKWSKESTFIKNDPEKWEVDAIKKHVDLAPHLSTQAFGVYIRDTLECIVIYHLPPQKGWLVANHIKYNFSKKGIFGYATHQLAITAQTNAIEWINFEQDLGKEGIRNSKMLFRPEKFIHRYTVSFAPDFKNQ